MISNIFSISLIIASVLVSLKSTNSWFSPSSFFSFMWLFFFTVPQVFAGDFQLNNYGMWFITLFVMSFTSGSILASEMKVENFKLEKFTVKVKNLVGYLCFVNLVIIFGILSLIYFSSAKYSINILLIDWLSIPNLISVDRYAGNLNYPIYVKYSLYFIYIGNILSGVILAQKKINNLDKIVSYLPIIFSIVIGSIEGSRSGILLNLVIFSSSWISARIVNNNGKLNISLFNGLIRFFFVIVIFTLLFIGIQWLRQGLDPIIFDLIVQKLRVYYFGYLSAFTLWLGNYYEIFSTNVVINTFAGPLNLIGALDRPGGFYDPIYINNYDTTNIFTAFRGLVSDFSISGSLMISLILGYFYQNEFQRPKTYSMDGVITLAIFYSFTLYSPLISIFHYNSIFFSFLITYFIIKVCK